MSHSSNNVTPDSTSLTTSGKKKGQQQTPSKAASARRHLNEEENLAFKAATSHTGYLLLEECCSEDYWQSHPLASLHRQWCDSQVKPQIIAMGIKEQLGACECIVDLSTLRLGTLEADGSGFDILNKWRTDIETAADKFCMTLDDDIELKNVNDDAISVASAKSAVTWSKTPIWRLPVVSLGVHRGENASAMAAELAHTWQTRNDVSSKPKKTRRKKKQPT